MAVLIFGGTSKIPNLHPQKHPKANFILPASLIKIFYLLSIANSKKTIQPNNDSAKKTSLPFQKNCYIYKKPNACPFMCPNANHQENNYQALEDFCHGNNEAILPFYQSVRSQLYLTAYKFIKRKEDIEDVISDVFEKLLQMSPEKRKEKFLTENINLQSYMLTAIKNRCLDKIKISKNRTNIINDVQGEKPKSTQNDVWEKFIHVSLEQLTKILPERDQHILKLKINGYKRNEISEMLNLSPKTVSKSLSMSRNKLNQTFVHNITFVCNILKKYNKWLNVIQHSQELFLIFSFDISEIFYWSKLTNTY